MASSQKMERGSWLFCRSRWDKDTVNSKSIAINNKAVAVLGASGGIGQPVSVFSAVFWTCPIGNAFCRHEAISMAYPGDLLSVHECLFFAVPSLVSRVAIVSSHGHRYCTLYGLT